MSQQSKPSALADLPLAISHQDDRILKKSHFTEESVPQIREPEVSTCGWPAPLLWAWGDWDITGDVRLGHHGGGTGQG